jgi:maltodextrin utilization protein YvdJ
MSYDRNVQENSLKIPNQKKHLWFFAALLTILMLSACDTASPAAQTVEAYLDAMTSKDIDRVAVLVCPEFEDQAIMDVDAFQLVAPTLQDVQCAEIEQADGLATVQCSGKIVTTYNNETSDIDLSERTFQVINERGDWFVCGFR